MGLDNGVVVRDVKRSELSPFMRYSYEKDYHDGVEVCYWRKCWGLRSWFLREAYPNWNLNQYHFQMTEREINILLRIIRNYLRHPEDWDQSIWEFDEIKYHLHNQQWNLVLLRTWMRKHPDAYVYFYDSY